MNITKKGGCILINPSIKSIALVYRDQYDDYSFPKGHLEEGESLIECAIRETAEETKFDCKVLDENPIYIEKYVTPRGENVEVYYYVSVYTGKSDNTSTDTHKTLWVKYEDVYDLLSYDSSKKLWNSIKNNVLEYLKDFK